jgi:hypothetical protein
MTRFSSAIDDPPTPTAKKLAGGDIALKIGEPAPVPPPAVDLNDITALSEELLPLALGHPDFEQERLEGKSGEQFIL